MGAAGGMAAGGSSSGSIMGMMGGGSGGGGMMGSVGSMVGGVAALAYQKKILAPMLKKIGKEEAREIRAEGARIGAKQMVGYAKAGVRTDVGTPVQVMGETAARAELSALRALFERKWQIWSGEQQAKFQLAMSMMMMGGSAAQGLGQMQMGGQSVSTRPYSGSGYAAQYQPSMAPGGSDWNRASAGVYSPSWLR